MKTMDCRSVGQEIDARERNQGLSGGATEHLAHCAGCRQIAEQGATLHALVTGLGTVSAPPDFDMRLRARLARERRYSSPWVNFWRQATTAPAVGLAFSLLVVVGLAVYLLGADPGGSGKLAKAPAAPTSQSPNVTTGAPDTAKNNPPVGIGQDPASDGKKAFSAPGSKDLTPPRQPRNEVVRNQKAGFTSREFNSLPAVTVKDSDPSAPVVSLSAPMQPVVVSMRDDRGGTRTISLPPVTFGSQKLIQNQYQPVSLASAGKGAW